MGKVEYNEGVCLARYSRKELVAEEITSERHPLETVLILEAIFNSLHR
jgi:hypothetical protein